jgi:DNA-binding NarL/FixJ family response regulator
MIRVLLIIDVPFYREGLASLLTQNADVMIVGSASNVESAAPMIDSCEPDH